MRRATVLSLAAMIVGVPSLLTGCSDDDPDTTPPTIAITNLDDGTVYSEVIEIAIDARDDDGVDRVELHVDGLLAGRDTSSPYRIEWRAGRWADDRSHTLVARAIDNAGNSASTRPVTVDVAASARTSPQPVHPEYQSTTHPDSMTFRWLPVADDDQYRLQLSPFSDFEYVILDTTVADSSFHWDDPMPGIFHWRVHALAADGAGDNWSRASSYRNVSVHRSTFHLDNQDILGRIAVSTADDAFALLCSPDFDSSGDVSLLKVASYGYVYSRQTIAHGHKNHISGVLETADGGFLVSGSARLGDAKELEVWLIWMDEYANPMRTATYGGDYDDWCNRILQTPDGGFLLTGVTKVGGDEQENVDIFLLRLDAAGEVVWERTFGGEGGSDYGNGIVALPSGGYLIAGGSATFSPDGDCAYLLEVDDDGSQVRLQTIRVDDSDSWGLFLAAGADGGVVLAGSFDPGSMNTGNPFAMAIDASGSVIWSTTWSSADWNGPWGLHRTADGGYLTLLYGQDPGGSYLQKLTPSGALSWSGRVHDYVSPLVVNADQTVHFLSRLRSSSGPGRLVFMRLDPYGRYQFPEIDDLGKAGHGAGVDLDRDRESRRQMLGR